MAHYRVIVERALIRGPNFHELHRHHGEFYGNDNWQDWLGRRGDTVCLNFDADWDGPVKGLTGSPVGSYQPTGISFHEFLRLILEARGVCVGSPGNLIDTRFDMHLTRYLQLD